MIDDTQDRSQAARRALPPIDARSWSLLFISLRGADNYDSLRGDGLNFVVLDE